MAKYIISEDVFSDGTHIYKVKHDINGNPRYIVHFSHIYPASYSKAYDAALDVGFKRCKKIEYHQYFICQECGGFNAVYKRIQQAKKLAL